MLQQNHKKGYEYTIALLKAGLGLGTSIICIEKHFLKTCSLDYARFNFYWLFKTDNQRDMWVLIAIKNDILNRIIIDNQIDLINHLYCFCLDIKKIDLKSGKILRKTRIFNLYDNKIG